MSRGRRGRGHRPRDAPRAARAPPESARRRDTRPASRSPPGTSWLSGRRSGRSRRGELPPRSLPRRQDARRIAEISPLDAADREHGEIGRPRLEDLLRARGGIGELRAVEALVLACHHGEEAPGRDEAAARRGEKGLRAEEVAKLLWPVVSRELPREGAEPRPVAARQDDRRVASSHAL